MTPEHLDKIKAERQKVYGDPRKNHEGIAQMWASILEPHWERIRDQKPLPPHVVAMMMALLKINRMRLRFHADNYDDAAVYLLQFSRDWQEQEDAAANTTADRAGATYAPIVDRAMTWHAITRTRRHSTWVVCSSFNDNLGLSPSVHVQSKNPHAAAIEYTRLCVGVDRSAASLVVFDDWHTTNQPRAWRVNVTRVQGDVWDVESVQEIDPAALAELAKEVVNG